MGLQQVECVPCRKGVIEEPCVEHVVILWRLPQHYLLLTCFSTVVTVFSHVSDLVKR